MSTFSKNCTRKVATNVSQKPYCMMSMRNQNMRIFLGAEKMSLKNVEKFAAEVEIISFISRDFLISIGFKRMSLVFLESSIKFFVFSWATISSFLERRLFFTTSSFIFFTSPTCSVLSQLSKYFQINQRNVHRIIIKIGIAIFILRANSIPENISPAIDPHPLNILYLERIFAYSDGEELLKI